MIARRWIEFMLEQGSIRRVRTETWPKRLLGTAKDRPFRPTRLALSTPTATTCVPGSSGAAFTGKHGSAAVESRDIVSTESMRGPAPRTGLQTSELCGRGCHLFGVLKLLATAVGNGVGTVS